MIRHRLPLYVHAYQDRHGKQRVYLRCPGTPSTALPGPLYSEAFWTAYHKAMNAESVPKPGAGASSTKPGSFNALIADYYKTHQYTSLQFHRKSKATFYVSCWHSNEAESSAMWKLYTSMNDAVCVKTTYRSLWNCLPNNIYLGLVRYIDYETEMVGGNSFDLVVQKRKSYEHEREVRAVLWSTSWDQMLKKKRKPGVRTIIMSPENVKTKRRLGYTVPVDLNQLVKEVYISPRAAPPLLEVITQLVADVALKVPVKQSEVNSPPAY